MNVNIAGFTTGVQYPHSADAAQRETELRNRHQEQFNKLRARLRSLETESAIMSQPVLELRRKQQELLASKRYAEAFEHMKIIKAAEKEVMQAHREEHRRVNEESVRKLLEDQARERESLRKSLRGASARVQTHPRSSGAGDRAGDPAKRPAPGRGGFDAGAPAISAAGVAGTEPRSIRHVDAWRAPSPGVYYYDVPSTAGPGVRSPPRDARGGEHASRGDRTRNREEEEASRKRVADARAHERALAAPVSARTGPPSAGLASMRSIPDTWQATAVNARPRGDGGAAGRAEPRATGAGAESLETAASALPAAALALVGGGDSARAGRSSTARGAEDPRAIPRARARMATRPRRRRAARRAASPRWASSRTRAVATRRRSRRGGGGWGDSPRRARATRSCRARRRFAPARRRSTRSARRGGAETTARTRTRISTTPHSPCSARRPRTRGARRAQHRFLAARPTRRRAVLAGREGRGARGGAPGTSARRGEVPECEREGHLTGARSVVQRRGTRRRAPVRNAGEDAADEARRGDADGGSGPTAVALAAASALPERTESRDALMSRVKKKTAAAKLLMRKASLSSATKAPRDDAVSEYSSPLSHGESRRPEEADEAFTDAATSERSSLASSVDADSPQKPRARRRRHRARRKRRPSAPPRRSKRTGSRKSRSDSSPRRISATCSRIPGTASTSR